METQFSKAKCILVPIDFSEVCDNALNHAIELSKHLECPVYALHVYDSASSHSYPIEAIVANANSQEHSMKDLVHDALKSYIQLKQYPRLHALLVEGELFAAIEETAHQLHAQLIVLGTHGKVGFQNIVGSYALKVIDTTRIPVIVVQNRAFQEGYKDVVFPVSLDDEDRQKTECAIKLSNMFHSKIHILYKKPKTLLKRFRLNRVVNQIIKNFEKHQVSYKVVASEQFGSSWKQQILQYSTVVSADLILILSNPRRHMILFDSKEEAFMFNQAEIPVMCITYKKTRVTSFFGTFKLMHQQKFSNE